MKLKAAIITAVLMTSGIWAIVCMNALTFGMHVGEQECSPHD